MIKQKFIYDKKQDEAVIMVGDGINDSLAMKEADISISFLNNASNETLLKSDCLLMEKDLLLVPKLISMTEDSYYKIQRDIDFSKDYNLAFGLLAMFGYYGPFSAKSLNTLNSIIAIMRSSRISAESLKIAKNKRSGRWLLMKLLKSFTMESVLVGLGITAVNVFNYSSN